MANYKKLIKKRRRDQEDTAHVFEDFIDTFQNPTPGKKTFVKSEEADEEKGKLYEPSAKLQSFEAGKIATECAKLIDDNKLTKSKVEKPKSNLVSLKEEFCANQTQRVPEVLLKKFYEDINLYELSLKQPKGDRKEKPRQSNDTLDTSMNNTTNLFLGELSSKLRETDLMHIFGKYGPLASVKIMLPRRSKNQNNKVGFVAFMSRIDSERAYADIGLREDMKVSWAKPIKIPAKPAYIPPELAKDLLPPPQTGLPFNAQPFDKNYKTPTNVDELNDLLYNSFVKVTIPTDNKIRWTIHKMVQFALKEGPELESAIMNKEMSNPLYQFLFENKSPAHAYYRWKLYSVGHGESINNYSLKPFRMFLNGPIWIPPCVPDYTKGMRVLGELKTPTLSDNQQLRLIKILRDLTTSRNNIAEAMVFCIDHVQGAEDVIKIISESFKNTKSNPMKKIARLYLITDILHNGKSKKEPFNIFVNLFEAHLSGIFEKLGLILNNLNESGDKLAFHMRVLKVLRTWEMWKMYSTSFLKKLESLFLNRCLDDDKPIDGKTLINRSLVYNSDRNLENEIENTNTNYIPPTCQILDPSEVDSQALTKKKHCEVRGDEKIKTEKLAKMLMTTVQDEEKEAKSLHRILVANTVEDDANNITERHEIVLPIVKYKPENSIATVKDKELKTNKLREIAVGTIYEKNREKLKFKVEKREKIKFKVENREKCKLDDDVMDKNTDKKRKTVRETELMALKYQDNLNSGKLRMKQQRSLGEDYRKKHIERTLAKSEEFSVEQKKLELTDKERRRLREIEMNVLKYQDDLERGKRRMKKGECIEKKLDDYRKKCIVEDNSSSEEEKAPKRKKYSKTLEDSEQKSLSSSEKKEKQASFNVQMANSKEVKKEKLRENEIKIWKYQDNVESVKTPLWKKEKSLEKRIDDCRKKNVDDNLFSLKEKKQKKKDSKKFEYSFGEKSSLEEKKNEDSGGDKGKKKSEKLHDMVVAKTKVLKRKQLREIEKKVLKYQDDLESRKRIMHKEKSLEEELNDYRKKCIVGDNSSSEEENGHKRNEKLEFFVREQSSLEEKKKQDKMAKSKDVKKEQLRENEIKALKYQDSMGNRYTPPMKEKSFKVELDGSRKIYAGSSSSSVKEKEHKNDSKKLDNSVAEKTSFDEKKQQASVKDMKKETEKLYDMIVAQTNDERRQKLREIEIKVLKYEDDLESGKRKTKKGRSLEEELHNFRRKCLKKMVKKSKGFAGENSSLGKENDYKRKGSLKNVEVSVGKSYSSSKETGRIKKKSEDPAGETSSSSKAKEHKRKRHFKEMEDSVRKSTSSVKERGYKKKTKSEDPGGESSSSVEEKKHRKKISYKELEDSVGEDSSVEEKGHKKSEDPVVESSSLVEKERKRKRYVKMVEDSVSSSVEEKRHKQKTNLKSRCVRLVKNSSRDEKE